MTSVAGRVVSLEQQTVARFKQVTRQYALFHIGFCSLAFLEVVLFALFFSFFTQTTLLAFSLAALFLTGFTYFVLLFYLQTKKPQDLADILTFFEKGNTSSLIESLSRLLAALHQLEYTYYGSSTALVSLMQKFSAWIHWKDLHKMNEMILKKIIREHLRLIRENPTDSDIHASLAETYVLLAELYTDPTELTQEVEDLWTSPEYHSALFVAKRKKALSQALEEYKILDFYTPENPSIYEHLAKIYYDLQEMDKAMHAYELIVTKRPEDRRALFDLGSLYFENGKYAQGLQVYEKLKRVQDERCDELLSYYDREDV
ncbi:MAG: hypothetical protein RLZZ453_575 [Chlamydiota bacterium]|jgi:tetratricopeptide (TPR) repeat protein